MNSSSGTMTMVVPFRFDRILFAWWFPSNLYHFVSLTLSYANIINDWPPRTMYDFVLISIQNFPTLQIPLSFIWCDSFDTNFHLSFRLLVGHFILSSICYNKNASLTQCLPLLCASQINSFFSLSTFAFKLIFFFFHFFQFFLKCRMSTETNLNGNRFGATNQTRKESSILSFTRFHLGNKTKNKTLKLKKTA